MIISSLEQLLSGITADAATTALIIVGVLCGVWFLFLFSEAMRSIGAVGLAIFGLDFYFYFTKGLFLLPILEGLYNDLSAQLGAVVTWIIIVAAVAVLALVLLFKFTAWLVLIPLGVVSIDAVTLINAALVAGEITPIVAALYYALIAFVLGFAFYLNRIMPHSDIIEETSRPFGKDYIISNTVSLFVRTAIVFVLMLVLLSIDVELAAVGYLLVGVIPTVSATLFICRLFTYADETADLLLRANRSLNRLFTKIDIGIYTVLLRIALVVAIPFKYLFRGLWWLIKKLFLAIKWLFTVIFKFIWIILKLLWRLRVVIIILAVIAGGYFLVQYLFF